MLTCRVDDNTIYLNDIEVAHVTFGKLIFSDVNDDSTQLRPEELKAIMTVLNRFADTGCIAAGTWRPYNPEEAVKHLFPGTELRDRRGAKFAVTKLEFTQQPGTFGCSICFSPYARPSTLEEVLKHFTFVGGSKCGVFVPEK